MADADTLTKLTPYAQRLFDDYIVENAQAALDNLSAAARRLRRKPSRAVDDRKLQRHVRHAAQALRNTALALQDQQPRRRSRKPLLLLAGLALGGAAALSNEALRRRLTNSLTRQPETQTAGEPPDGELPPPAPSLPTRP